MPDYEAEFEGQTTENLYALLKNPHTLPAAKEAIEYKLGITTPLATGNPLHITEEETDAHKNAVYMVSGMVPGHPNQIVSAVPEDAIDLEGKDRPSEEEAKTGDELHDCSLHMVRGLLPDSPENEEAQGSGSEKYGASDWTSAGQDKDGFPVEKGSKEDVTK